MAGIVDIFFYSVSGAVFFNAAFYVRSRAYKRGEDIKNQTENVRKG